MHIELELSAAFSLGLSVFGRSDQSVGEGHRAGALDPLSSGISGRRGIALRHRRIGNSVTAVFDAAGEAAEERGRGGDRHGEIVPAVAFLQR